MWFFLAVLSAIIYSFRSILEKISLQKVDHYILALAVRLFALPLFVLPFVLGITTLPNLAEVPLQFWGAVFLVSIISTPLEMIFFYKALKTEEVSYVAPLLGMSPLVTTFLGVLVFKEYPNVYGILGIIIIIVALYLLNVEKEHRNILDPFKHLVSNKAFKYIFIMLLSYSLGILIDKFAIISTNVYFYALVNYFFVSLSLFFIAFFKAKEKFIQLKTNFKQFSVIGWVVAGYTWLRFFALDQGPAGYVAAVLSSNVFFSVLLGVILFKEKRAVRKITVGILVLVGLSIIKIWG